MAMKTVISWIIPLVILILLGIWLYGGGGLLDKIKGTANATKAYLPDVTIGAKEITASPAKVPEEHKAAILKLADAIKNMKQSTQQECFEGYGGLPVLGDEETVIELSSSGAAIKVQQKAGGGQIDAALTREFNDRTQGVQYCVIAEEPYAENFARAFLNAEPWNTKLLTLRGEDHYVIVRNIRITNEGGSVNTIDYGLDSSALNDGGILYKAADSTVCFFPTTAGGSTCRTRGTFLNPLEVLDDDCLGSGVSELALKRQLEQGLLQRCQLSPPQLAQG